MCRMRASAFVCVSLCASEWHSHRRVEKVMVGMVVLALVVLQDLSAQPVHPPLAGPGADVAGVRRVPVLMWHACASRGADVAGVRQSRYISGRGAPSPDADVAGVRPVLVQMWQGCA